MTLIFAVRDENFQIIEFFELFRCLLVEKVRVRAVNLHRRAMALIPHRSWSTVNRKRNRCH